MRIVLAERHHPIRAKAAALGELAPLDCHHVVIHPNDIPLAALPRSFHSFGHDIHWFAESVVCLWTASWTLDKRPCAQHIYKVPVRRAAMPVSEEPDGVWVWQKRLVERGVGPRMRKVEERPDVSRTRTAFSHYSFDGSRCPCLRNAPIPPEEVIALDGLVPYRLVFLAPDTLPVGGNVRA